MHGCFKKATCECLDQSWKSNFEFQKYNQAATMVAKNSRLVRGTFLVFFQPDTCAHIFCWCCWGSQRNVKHAQTKEKRAPALPAEFD